MSFNKVKSKAIVPKMKLCKAKVNRLDVVSKMMFPRKAKLKQSFHIHFKKQCTARSDRVVCYACVKFCADMLVKNAETFPKMVEIAFFR